MKDWHPLLERQLRKYWYGKYVSPEMSFFLDAISESYSYYDRDHFLLERAMELSSTELTDVNQKLREELKFKLLAEEVIHTKDQILNTINKNLREAVYRSHTEGGLVYVNQAYVDLFGYDSEEEVLNTPSGNFYADPETRKKLSEKFESSGGSIKGEEVLFKRKNGVPFWGMMSTILSTDGSGSSYFDGSIIDISHQKRNEANLRKANELLKKTNAELDRFVYSASHDLRAPLRSLLGLVQLLELEPEQDILPHLERMRKSIYKLDHFIDDIIDYSRNSRLDIASELIHFDELIEESFQHFKYLPSADKIEKRIQVQAPVSFYGDKKRIQIIFNNLISNAINYHNPDEQHPFIKVEVLITPQHGSLLVCDNGLGIDDEHIEKIFDMFYRGTANSTGSGLGLYIVKETLEKMSGKIRVTSQKNKGSVFSIDIPNLPQGTTPVLPT